MLLKDCWRQAEKVLIARYEKIGFRFFAKGKIMVVLGISGEGDFSRNGNTPGEGQETMNFILDDRNFFVKDFLSEFQGERGTPLKN